MVGNHVPTFFKLSLLLISLIILLFGCNNISQKQSEKSIPENFGPYKELVFKPINIMTSGIFILENSRNNQHIKDFVLHLIEPIGENLITSVKSNSTGEVKVDELIIGKEYLMKVSNIGESWESITNYVGQPYIHESSDGVFTLETYIVREANHIDVPTVLQNPELPNGCEITSLTAVLNYFGIDVHKTEMADVHLPQKSFGYENGKKTGPDPRVAFAGNPRSLNGGWYVFADPIVKAAEGAIAAYGSALKVSNVSGSDQEEILSYIDRNIPVVMWVTLDFSPPIKRGGWSIQGTNEFHSSFTNLHAVVLEGWEDGKVHIMNPLKGHMIIPENLFFESYVALGSQAVVVEK